MLSRILYRTCEKNIFNRNIFNRNIFNRNIFNRNILNRNIFTKTLNDNCNIRNSISPKNIENIKNMKNMKENIVNKMNPKEKPITWMEGYIVTSCLIGAIVTPIIGICDYFKRAFTNDLRMFEYESYPLGVLPIAVVGSIFGGFFGIFLTPVYVWNSIEFIYVSMKYFI